MTIKPPLSRVAGLAGLVVGLLIGPGAGAQTAGAQPTGTLPNERSIEVQLFRPAIGPRNFLTVDSTELLGHKLLGFGVTLNYQTKPYQLEVGDTTLTTVNVVKQQLTADLAVAIGLRDRVQLGLDLPITAVLRGEAIDAVGAPTGADLDTRGLGDLRLLAKVLIGTAGEDDQFSLAAVGGLTLPTGKDSTFLGDKNVTGIVKAVGGWQAGGLRMGINLGAVVRQTSHLFDTQLGSELTFGAAAAYTFPRHIDGIVEVFGRSGLVDFTQFYRDVNPIEVDGAVRVPVNGRWTVTAGGGTGLGQGIGAPQLRFFAGAMFTPNFRDQDHDGVPDSLDKCVSEPEDRDGYEDDDGCPDPDNDGDGILDADDKCPNEPEDKDQFQDEDGCPEPDNDGDGITDINDACPNAKEDGQGKNPHDGCPMAAEDADGDGIIDTLDKCPDEPEDKDGFQDEDGCPDVDNDNDGVPDGFDSCPNEAEDADGFEDEDGCPDPDNDHDGFPDTADKCPNQPETLNGIQDDDGCPDAGAEIVHLKPRRIELDTALAFQVQRGQASSLKEPSVAAVGTVALLLRAHPEVKKVRIQVQAEKVSMEESQRRADIVRDTLVSKGIEFGRLTSLGVGPGPGRVDFIIETVTLAPATAPPPAKAPTKPATKPTTPDGTRP